VARMLMPSRQLKRDNPHNDLDNEEDCDEVLYVCMYGIGLWDFDK
jgi:hypothetical protein